ncbi:MAG TPA: hypothetical protein VKR52_11775 [Terracidiphilus sp.]|nr:hypothetical protein [Terracidiphilus sp.]
MNPPRENGFAGRKEAPDAEETLRLIAGLPAPRGLEERVKRSLRMDSGGAKVMEWPAEFTPGQRWTQGPWVRCAAAAAIVLVVAGGSWGVYPHRQTTPAPKATVLPHIPAAHGFENANAIRTPQTLQGPVVKKVPQGTGAKTSQKNTKSKPHAGAKAAGNQAP